MTATEKITEPKIDEVGHVPDLEEGDAGEVGKRRNHPAGLRLRGGKQAEDASHETEASDDACVPLSGGVKQSENGEKKDEDSKSGTWKVEGDDIVLMGKDEDGKEEGFKFNKDTLKLSAMTKDGEDGLDMLKALMGEEGLTLKKL